MSVETILWLFFIYAFLGWCLEVIYSTVTRGHFANCGFLSGPYCPIYGVGAIIVLIATAPFQQHLGWLFLSSAILTSTLELIVGWALKALFRQTWWDYSDRPFNIGGFICLEFSIIWGLACVFLVRIAHPPISTSLPLLTSQLGMIGLWLLSIAFAADFIATLNHLLKLKKQLILIDEIDQQMLQLADNLGEKIHDASKTVLKELNNLKNYQDELLAKIITQNKRLFKAFPDSSLKPFLNKTTYQDLLAKLKPTSTKRTKSSSKTNDK